MAKREDVIMRIEELVRSGELKPGKRLPSERALAARCGASRGSVREAMRALAGQGLVETRRGDGSYLVDGEAGALSAALAGSAAARKARVSQIFEFREMLEPAIAAKAARNASPAQLERLKAIVCDQQRRLLDKTGDADLDAAFHLGLARASKNPVVYEVLAAISGILSETRAPDLRGPKRRSKAVAAHLRIIDALEARDPERCARAMREHLADARREALESEQRPNNL